MNDFRERHAMTRRFQIVRGAQEAVPAPEPVEVEAESFQFIDALTVQFTLSNGASMTVRLPDVFCRIKDDNGSEFSIGTSYLNVDGIVRRDIEQALLVIAGKAPASNRDLDVEGAAKYLAAVLDHHGTL